MRHLLLRLWREEAGCVPGPEWAVIATILVLGAITAVVSTRSITLDDPEAPPAQLAAQ
jgi:Flp pilus assembly pilin Flp